MQLYAQPAGPRPEPFYSIDSCPTPAAAYRLQQELRKAYREVLFQWWSLDALVVCCFGPRTGKRLQAMEDRLQYEVPELLERLSLEELRVAASVFYSQTLVGFVWHILAQERTVQHRLGNRYHDQHIDAGHAKAAGLGWVNPRPKAITAPEAIAAPCEQCQLPAPALSANHDPVPVSSSLTAHQLLLYRVKRVQERRRLKKRKRQ